MRKPVLTGTRFIGLMKSDAMKLRVLILCLVLIFSWEPPNIFACGFTAARSFGSMSGLKRFPTDVVISAAVGEVIGRVLAHHRHDSSNQN